MSLHADQPPRRRSPGIGPRALCALLLALQAPGCGGGAQDLGPTAKVEKGRIERIVVATGTIEPIREVEVRPRIAGIIEKIHVDEGDVVAPGQPLVEIERELLASQVREAEAALREARVELRFAKIDVDRSDELERSGATSAQKRDAAQARYERAQALVARAEAALDTLSTAAQLRDGHLAARRARARRARRGGQRGLARHRRDGRHAAALARRHRHAAPARPRRRERGGARRARPAGADPHRGLPEAHLRRAWCARSRRSASASRTSPTSSSRSTSPTPTRSSCAAHVGRRRHRDRGRRERARRARDRAALPRRADLRREGACARARRAASRRTSRSESSRTSACRCSRASPRATRCASSERRREQPRRSR